MVSFGAPRQIACFYCGRRSGPKPDAGQTRSFVCRHCDATNHLDANGLITDPPPPPTPASPRRFAAPQPGAPPPAFCEKCHNNQHLFTTSLAQYLPATDVADDDDDVLDREYYSFRRRLEQRYPQVCDACADMVDKRLREAGYTAKTDHLRRMVELSRGQRASTAKRGSLDWVHSFGAGVWVVGFALQMLWHVKAVVATKLHHEAASGMRDPDESWVWVGVVVLAQFLPDAERLVWWSIAAGVASAWWNPHFVQVNRGFTRHLLGFTQWYSFQGLIVFFRLAARSLLSIEGGQSQSLDACLGAHVVLGAVMMLIYVLAKKSICVDTSPLFASSNYTFKRPTCSDATQPTSKIRTDTRTLSELVEETLGPAQPKPASALPLSGLDLNAPRTTTFSHDAKTPTNRKSYAATPDEMDWSPIPPPARALWKQSTQRRESPNLQSNPFSRPVPAAPSRSAAAPIWGTAAKDTRSEDTSTRFSFRGPRGEFGEGLGRGAVEFKQPSFFANRDIDDDDKLAELLNRSFCISPHPPGHDSGEDTEPEERDEQPSTWGAAFRHMDKAGQRQMNNNMDKTRQRQKKKKKKKQKRWSSRGLPGNDLVLAALLGVWCVTLVVAPYRAALQPGVMAVAGVISLRDAGDRSRHAQSDVHMPGLGAWVVSALGVAELAALCWVGNEAVWGGAVGKVGGAVLGGMLVWRVVR